jgi:hypothetical protein
MSLNTKITNSSFSFQIPPGANSQEFIHYLNQFIKGTSETLAALADAVNELREIVAEGVKDKDNPQTISGENTYIDSTASETKDFGLFYHSPEGRPLTIHEGFLLVAQLLAEIKSQLGA